MVQETCLRPVLLRGVLAGLAACRPVRRSHPGGRAGTTDVSGHGARDPARGPRGSNRGECGGTGRARSLAESRGDRATLRLSDHELHGRHVDRGAGPHRLCASRHAEDDGSAGRRAEPAGVARGNALRAARWHPRPAPGRADVLVLCDHLHLHSRRQLGRSPPRRRHDRMGPSDGPRLQGRSAVAFAAPTPTST